MTWTIKIRSSPGALMASDYECPFHGRFTATVARDANGDPPDEVPCPFVEALHNGSTGWREVACSDLSPFRISMPAVHTQFVVSAYQGKPAPKPHPNAMDTRPLAEGQRKKFRESRRAIRREYRHQRLKDYLR